MWLFIFFFVLIALAKDLVALPVKQNIRVDVPLLSQLAHHRFYRNFTMRLYGGEAKKDQAAVNVVDPVRVMVGGHSIGVFLHAGGVVVIGRTTVQDAAGRKHDPAANAGLAPGDLILKVNGQPVQSDKQLQGDIDRIGRRGLPAVLEVKRGKRLFSVSLYPVFCRETGRYRIGLFVRDSTAGMGTLTFYEPKTRCYGALGHMVTDAGTTRKIDLTDGQITNAVVQDIYPGQKGKPGEKVGLYQGSSGLVGNIKKNTPFGIFGQLKNPPGSFFYTGPVPAAMTYEIREGPAEILTVLKGENIERFTIEIEKVIPHLRSDGKGLVIRVTDQKLIRRAGGIVQGMSGSPIIQKGKFVGAVTHVFINDPARGFGVPAEWMLREAGFFASEDWANESA